MTEPTLAKFKLEASDEDPIPLLGDVELEVVDVREEHVIAECDQAALVKRFARSISA